MNIKEFMEAENIKNTQFKYYIDDKTGKKTPIHPWIGNSKFAVPNENGKLPNIYCEDFSNTIEQIDEINNMNIYNKFDDNNFEAKRKYDNLKKCNINLSANELNSRRMCYCLYLKYTENIYCVDIDEIDINSMDDFILKTGLTVFEDCPWVLGKNKGIHIYIKIDGDVKKYEGKNKFKAFKGDFLKNTACIWECYNAIVENYNVDDGIPIFEFDEDLKCLFETVENNDVKIDEVKNEIVKIDEIQNENLELQRNELKFWINQGINNLIFSQLKNDYATWINIGIIIRIKFKNGFDNEGQELFLKLSRQHPSFSDDEHVIKQYNSLPSNQGLNLATLIKYFNDVNKDFVKNTRKQWKDETKKNDKSANDNLPIPEATQEDLLSLNLKYLSSLKKNYNEQKKYFERFACKILYPDVMYIVRYYDLNTDEAKDKKDQTLKREAVDNFLKNDADMCKFLKTVSTYDENNEKKSFWDVWSKDENILMFDKVYFKPYNGPMDENWQTKKKYNTFTGYNSNCYIEYNEQNQEKIFKSFKDVFMNLCGSGNCDNEGNIIKDTNEQLEKNFNYVFSWFAHIIQKPNEKMTVCPILKGLQGVGKSLILDIMGKVLGHNHYITSSNPDDFFSDHAEGHANKLLINMNECEGKATFNLGERMKSFITERTLTVNPKGIRPYEIENVARLIITTNKTNPIVIKASEGDRRYCVFQATEKYKNKGYNSKWWASLYDYINRPEFIAYLYNKLNNLDISKINFTSDRPITKAYIEMCRLSIPREAYFLDYFINNDEFNSNITLDENEFINRKNENIDEIKIKQSKMYELYVGFCRKVGYIKDTGFQKNITQFKNEIYNERYPIAIKTLDGYGYFQFKADDIMKYLKQKKYIDFDENEIIEEEIIEEFEFEGY